MKVTITSTELKSPLKFFPVSYRAMKIIRQLGNTNCVEKKSTGFWTKHYTMTLWQNENDLRSFAKSADHLEAMKNSASIAKEIRALTTDADRLPPWKEAKSLLLVKGRSMKY